MNRHFTLVTLLLASVACLNAQQPSASVVGRVTDATGAVIPGVAITITNLNTNISQSGSSNQTGDFTIPYLNPGRYKMEATLTGFRSYKHSEFALMVDQVLRVDLRLEVGSAAESITVTGCSTSSCATTCSTPLTTSTCRNPSCAKISSAPP